GFKHEFQRFDRNRYVKFNTFYHVDATHLAATACSDEANVARVNSSTSIGMFGPYDYKSAMMYNVTHPDITRWDGSEIVPGTACNTSSAGTLPPQCFDTDC